MSKLNFSLLEKFLQISIWFTFFFIFLDMGTQVVINDKVEKRKGKLKVFNTQAALRKFV